MVISNGQVVYTGVSASQEFDFLTEVCNKAITQGVLPPADVDADVMAPAAKPFDVAKPVFGLIYSSVPEGAYVSSAPDGYPASKAGLVAGMVIEKINGISLKGMSYATMVTIFDAASNEVTFDIIGHGPVKVTRGTAAAH